MKSPTVSVIMATYNHADFVTQSIESVLRQRNINFEFLISDDGSSDKTKEAVSSIHDKRIIFFPYEFNRGACIATNELISRASGEFIAIINSDDCWSDETKLSSQLKLLIKNPEIGACFGRACFIDVNGQKISKKKLTFGKVFDQKNKSQGKWLRHFFEYGNCLCHPTILIRRSCYKELGLYNNRLRQLPDFDMWVRLVKRYKIFISDQDLIDFRIMPGENASSQTPINSIRTINEHYLIAESFFNDVSRSLLIDGFSDLLIQKNINSNEHMNIEKTLLYFVDNEWLSKPYNMIGLLKLNSLLNDTVHRNLLANDYGIDDRWFQQKMGDIDVLRQKNFFCGSQSKTTLFNKINRLINRFLS